MTKKILMQKVVAVATGIFLFTGLLLLTGFENSTGEIQWVSIIAGTGCLFVSGILNLKK